MKKMAVYDLFPFVAVLLLFVEKGNHLIYEETFENRA